MTTTLRAPALRRHAAFALRLLLITAGAYGLGALAAAALAIALPMARADAVLAAIMAGFLIQLIAALWAAHASSPWRTALTMAAAAAALALWLGWLRTGVPA